VIGEVADGGQCHMNSQNSTGRRLFMSIPRLLLTRSYGHVRKVPAVHSARPAGRRPGPDGVQLVGVLASLVTAHPGLPAVIRALVTPWPTGPDDTSGRQADRGS